MTVDTAVPTLEVADVTVRFAGLTALANVGFTVEPGSLHAIIGPNGAGKSTCFNVISGVYRAAEGTVRFGDAELTRLRPHQIAELGLARSFQNIVLSPRSTVEENLMLGRHVLTRAGFLSTGIRLPAALREQRRHRERVREVAAFLGLDRALSLPAGLLPYGDQKKVELGRALSMEPRLLLLDEPVAGMNAAERREMVAIVNEIRAALGISILLVEHDMGIIMRLADVVTVLDFGRRIAQGTPAEIQQDPVVVQAYLGGAENPGDANRAIDGTAEETQR